MLQWEKAAGLALLVLLSSAAMVGLLSASGSLTSSTTGGEARSRTIGLLSPATQPRLAPSNVPPGIRFYVPINITNTQTTSTPAPFQDLLIVDSSSFFYYEAPGLQNVQFFSPDGTVIPSWLERGASNNYTTTAYWLRLANGIPASSHITIYMGFANRTSTVFNTKTTGEAPTLSPVYGQYDDGARVFQFYDNFNGTNLDSNWRVTSNTGATGSVTVHDGLSVSGSNDWYGVISTSSFVLNKSLVDFDGYFSSLTGPDTNEFGWNNPFSSTPDTLYAINNYHGQYSLFNFNGRVGSEVGIAVGPTTSPDILSMWTSIQDSSASINYTHTQTNSGSFIGEASAHLVAYATSGSEFLQWVRFRTVPPKMVMPSSQVVGPIIYVSSSTVSCTPSVVAIGSGATCTLYVSGIIPTGNVTWTNSGFGRFSVTWCILKPYILVSSYCSVGLVPTTLGSITVTASFPGDYQNYKSSGSFNLGVVRSASTTSVSCSPSSVPPGSSTACIATVEGYSPTGTIAWNSNQRGTFSPANICTISSGSCPVGYVPVAVTPTVSINANYSGDSNNVASSGTFVVTISAVTTTSTTTTTTQAYQTTTTTSRTTTSVSVTSQTTASISTLTFTLSTPSVSTSGTKTAPIFDYTPYLYAVAIVVIIIVAYAALTRRRRGSPSPTEF